VARSPRAKAPLRARVGLWGRQLRQSVRDPLLLSAAGVVLLHLLDTHVWVGALVHELSFPLALGALVVAAVCAFRHQHARALALVACALLLAKSTLSYWRSSRPTPSHGPTLRVAQAHAADAALSAASLARWLARSQADVVSLTGLRADDAPTLSREQPGYARMPADNAKTALLLVKRTLHAQPPRAGGRALVRLGRCQLELVQVDLPSLFAATALSERRQRIAELARSKKTPLRVYLGHFGSASDAADLAPLRDSQEVRDARLGHGRLATAPDPLGPLGLPVDQVLLHGWILAREADSEAPLAKDMHRTLTTTLELTEPRCRALATGGVEREQGAPLARR
jgi:hypothetical protein